MASRYGDGASKGSSSYRFQMIVARARQKSGTENPDKEEHEARSEGEEDAAQKHNANADAELAEADLDSSELNILTARVRREIRAATVATGKARLRLLKKSHAKEWLANALASSTMPPVHRMGTKNTFNYSDANHPWAKIHSSHEAWFCDRIASCRQCGCSASKKSTLDKSA